MNPNPANLEDRFKRLKEKVLAKRPVLQTMLAKRGEKKLLDYANEYVDVNLSPTIPFRQAELLEVMEAQITKRFGLEIAESAIAQLKEFYFVSTADHSGPLTHPFFLNSNLLTAASLVSHNKAILNNVIVLSCANIAYNNSSFPRGLFFHNYINNEVNTHRIPFLSAKPTPHSIYGMKPYTASEVKKVYALMKEDVNEGKISPEHQKKTSALIKEIYEHPEIFQCESYCEQVGKTNFKLWNKFFEASNVQLPNLIFLEQETLVVELLTKYHLHQDTILNHMLFDPRYEPFINNYFEDIFGSFSRKDSTGTYLFWALPKGSRENLQLWRKGNYLVSKDESYKIELQPELIKDAMARKELIPGLLLNFCTLCFYYGLKCLGGFNQVNYLTLMKNNYIKMNADLGNYRSIEICARAQTREMNDGLSVAFMEYGNNKELMLASGLDLILYGNKDSWSAIMDITKNITLEEAFNPILPEVYRISYDKTEWEEDLLSVTDKDISNLTNLNKKIKPCITMN
ncbi:hypothetical protein HZA40_01110 [Candidatus Peregrinibacteria bacterium]|nr:hypothetical protein [Candidatus Peregrinibacteria bacterium]